MKTLKETGGARIGFFNASWPLATLKVTEEELQLKVFIFGTYSFQASDIHSIESYTVLPVLGQGIKINHNVSSYSSHIVFWTFSNPKELIKEIEDTGFFSREQSKLNIVESAGHPKRSPFALTWPFMIMIVVLWNALSFIDTKALFNEGKLIFGFGKGFILSSLAVMTSLLLLLFSPRVQKFALREGRQIKDISKFIYFILFILFVLTITRLFTSH